MGKNYLTYLLLTLILFNSCNNKPIESFELSIADYNYAAAYSVLYKLSNEKLTITYRGELEGEIDTLLFSSTKLPKKQIRELSEINIDSLYAMYINPCTMDGYIQTIHFEKNGKSKTIRLENYYHPELYQLIETINNIVPEKFKIYNSKQELIELMDGCPMIEIIEEWPEE